MHHQQIKEVQSHKHLGLYLTNDGSWHDYIQYIKEKAWAWVNTMRKLKFKLDRKSLEIIYTTFIRPILEYGNMYGTTVLITRKNTKKIQHEAVRIATGSTRLISVHNHYNEIKWESFQKRRDDHKATFFFKVKNNLVPKYLSSLVPLTIGSASRCSLCNADNLKNINTKTALYSNSFLPSAVRNWNELPHEAKQIESINSFKHFLARERKRAPVYHYTGKSLCQILHTRLRTNCSSLNYYLFSKHITDSPLCRCGTVEDANHYFFECRMYGHCVLSVDQAFCES